MKYNNDIFLLITGYYKDVNLSTNQELLYNVLKKLPGKIGMNAIIKPVISEAGNTSGLEGYVSGYVPVDISNITISTYPNRIVACVHSCKDFNPKKVLDFLKESYGCYDTKSLCCHESDFKE